MSASLSIDDLVASLSANHIGQEALDLQAFKTQMKALLAQPPPASSARRNSLAQPHAPCSPRTTAPMQIQMQADDADRMDEDMVEDMLDAPASPLSPPPASFFPPSSSSSSHNQYQNQQRAPPSSPQLAPQATHTYYSPSYAHAQHQHQLQHQLQPEPTFTSTDPFYLSLTQSCPPRAFAPAFGMPIELVDR